MPRILLLILATVTVLGSGAVAAQTTDTGVQPYRALYSVSRNGKTVGKVEITLQQEGENWNINSALSGTHGLARILRISDHEQVNGIITEGRFLPQTYERHNRIAGVDNRWLVKFDWQESVISVRHDKKTPLELHMPAETLDPLTLKLEMRRRLNDPEPDLRFHMVEEEKIDQQNFRLLDDEWLETSLGCLETRPVEKIRKNSKRYTRAWHASELANIEVRIEHGKTGGDHVELRITELTLGDVDIVPRPACSSRSGKS